MCGEHRVNRVKQKCLTWWKRYTDMRTVKVRGSDCRCIPVRKCFPAKGHGFWGFFVFFFLDATLGHNHGTLLQGSKITKALRLWTGKTSESVFKAWHLFTQQAIASGEHADGYYVLHAW